MKKLSHRTISHALSYRSLRFNVSRRNGERVLRSNGTILAIASNVGVKLDRSLSQHKFGPLWISICQFLNETPQAIRHLLNTGIYEFVQLNESEAA